MLYPSCPLLKQVRYHFFGPRWRTPRTAFRALRFTHGVVVGRPGRPFGHSRTRAGVVAKSTDTSDTCSGTSVQLWVRLQHSTASRKESKNPVRGVRRREKPNHRTSRTATRQSTYHVMPDSASWSGRSNQGPSFCRYGLSGVLLLCWSRYAERHSD